MANKTATQVADIIDAAIGEASRLTSAELLEVGHMATTMILARTKKGLDADGRKFAAYSKDYLADRVKHSLSAQPDLARTGHMLGSMGPSVTGPEEVTIGFASRAEATKAAAHTLPSRRGTLREFFDIRQEAEKQAINEVIGRDVVTRIEKVVK